MANMKLYDLANMIGYHLGWANRVESQFLSWTISILFVFTHMMRRHELGQGGVYWSFGDRRQLIDEDGSLPRFYSAVDLLHHFVKHMNKLNENWSRKLDKRRFSQEYTSFGEFFCLNGTFVHVALETLVEEGLFELCPELILDGALCREQLYKHQVALKAKLHYEAVAKPITKRNLELADNLARLFRPPGQTTSPLFIFLMLLGVRKRPNDNPVFKAWIKDHYTCKHLDLDGLHHTLIMLPAQDALGCISPDLHLIPANLPDVAQMVKLLREAIDTLQMPNDLLPPVHLDHSNDFFEDVKKRFRYKLHKARNYRSEKLLAEGWHDPSSSAAERSRKAYADSLEGQPEPPLNDSETEDEVDDEDGSGGAAKDKKVKKKKKKRSKKQRELYGIHSKSAAIEKDLKKKCGRLWRRAKSRQDLNDRHHIFLTEKRPNIYHHDEVSHTAADVIPATTTDDMHAGSPDSSKVGRATL